MNIKDLKLEDVVKRLDKSYELVCVDYQDDLSERTREIEQVIQKQDWSCLDELLDNEWVWDAQADSVDYILKELKDSLRQEYEFNKNELDNWFEENIDWLRDDIYNRDTSEVLEDLLRNTPDPVCFYDTGVEIYECCDRKDVVDMIRLVKKTLKIKSKDKTYDTVIDIMVQQASYGGKLVIYFKEDIQKLINTSDYNEIYFRDPMIAIIDTCNGSGDHTELNKYEFSLPFNPENIFLDKNIKYSYTYEVCGMYDSWCDCTYVSFKKTNKKKKINKSSLHNEQEREEQYNKVYKSGKCTFGDMDMKRHHNTFYLNEFPCGTHCKDCGTFWID